MQSGFRRLMKTEGERATKDEFRNNPRSRSYSETLIPKMFALIHRNCNAETICGASFSAPRYRNSFHRFTTYVGRLRNCNSGTGGLPKLGVPLWEVPRIRRKVFGGLYSGPLIWGTTNYPLQPQKLLLALIQKKGIVVSMFFSSIPTRPQYNHTYNPYMSAIIPIVSVVFSIVLVSTTSLSMP